MSEEQSAVQQLQWAVQALAASAAAQLTMYPEFVCPACELVSDFDNWSRATTCRSSPGITEEQRAALQAMQSWIESMEPTACFSGQSSLERQDWEHLRGLAAVCLAAFRWESALPPSGRSTYVQGV